MILESILILTQLYCTNYIKHLNTSWRSMDPFKVRAFIESHLVYIKAHNFISLHITQLFYVIIVLWINDRVHQLPVWIPKFPWTLDWELTMSHFSSKITRSITVIKLKVIPAKETEFFTISLMFFTTIYRKLQSRPRPLKPLGLTL